MAKANPIPTAAPTENSWFDFLTRLAFVIAVAVVVARVTFMDYSRARGSALAGFEVGAATPGGAGPGAALALDLLACVPAILVLARRASDRAYIVRWSWSAAPLLGLAAWAALSVLWASDQFAAVVGAGQFVAAAALLWAASQLVRSWRRLRLIAAIAVGTLLAIAAHCVMFAALDRPTLQKYWTAYVCPEPGHQTGKDEREHPGECGKTHADGKPRQLVQRRELILRQRGLAPGDFGAKQFENKVFAPEQQGFYNSPNTLGAVVVLLLLITAGVVWQKVRDDGLTPRGGEGGTSPALAYTVFAVAALLAVAGAGWLLFQSRSKTALATIVLGAGLLVTAWRMRAWLAANARRAFWGAVVMIVVATAAVVGHGLYHKTLFHETLTFRWQYWTGAMGLVARHPIAGVGMDNFGEHYLSTRLPEAPEEVADPHNLLVKYAAELGLVGLLLGLAWLGRLAWELTRPVGPVLSPEPVAPSKAKAGAMPRASAIKVVSVIAGLAIAINVLANIDLATGTLDGGDLLLDGLRRAMMLAVILIGATAAAVRSLKAPDVDERPTPLVLYAILAGLAVFVLHNLLDFSMSEPGPLWLFALLAGAALGVRQPSVAGQRRRTAVAAIALGVGVTSWLVSALFVWVPVAQAEDAARRAAVELAARDDKGNAPFGAVERAAKLLADARDAVRYNADYPFRAALALRLRPGFNPEVVNQLGLAIKTDPARYEYYRERARYLIETGQASAQADRVRAEFARALALNPNFVAMRLEYADFLASIGDKPGAISQYEAALGYDAQLKANEPKRLGAGEVEAVKRKIAGLRG